MQGEEKGDMIGVRLRAQIRTKAEGQKVQSEKPRLNFLWEGQRIRIGMIGSFYYNEWLMNDNYAARSGWLWNTATRTQFPPPRKGRTTLSAYVRSVTAAADAGQTAEAACALVYGSAPPSGGGRSAGTGRMRTPGGRTAAPSEWKGLG